MKIGRRYIFDQNFGHFWQYDFAHWIHLQIALFPQIFEPASHTGYLSMNRSRRKSVLQQHRHETPNVYRLTIHQSGHILRGQKICKLKQIPAVGGNRMNRHAFGFGDVIQKLLTLRFNHGRGN